MTTDGKRSLLPPPGALRVLGGYAAFAGALALWRVARGDGGWLGVLASSAVLAAIHGVSSGGRWRAMLRDWLPLLALPVLYAAVPWSAASVSMFDAAVQDWDRALFGTDPARTFAGAAPWRLWSETLHAAYLSYYLLIYVPPFLMYARGDRAAFTRTVLAFTGAMVGCFAVFCVFPVEGPRYAWPPPAGVPDGGFRRATLALLEGGSSRGTAFPSSHMAIALVMSLSSLRWDWRIGVPVAGATALLGVGAVYGGFHYGVDMVAGAAVGLAAWLLAGGVGGGRGAVLG